MNELLPLVINLASRNKDYIVFVGAGFSKDANIPSGWDIIIETLKPIYVTENNIKNFDDVDNDKISEWYQSHPDYKNLGYSDILELTKKCDIERREYLKQFFDNRQPGEAHKLLAKMVANDFIRFVFTTNFDNLIEKALDELNVEYDVIFSDDVLEQTQSWDRVKKCRIYKLHGDYKTGRLKNLKTELQALDPQIADDFQYIIDRHGIIVIGYAGRDEAIMRHFINRKHFTYPFYWQYVDKEPEETSEEYKFYNQLKFKYRDVHKREIHYIQNPKASSFLQDILDGIDKLNLVVLADSNSQTDFHSFIQNSDDKKIRGLTIELKSKFLKLYDEYKLKESLDNKFVYRFEVFEELLKKIEFIFNYVSCLAEYDYEKEIKSILDNIIPEISKDLRSSDDFICRSLTYYFIQCVGAIFFQTNKVDLIEYFYKYNMKDDRNQIVKLIENLYVSMDGWVSIGINKYNLKYHNPKYSIIRDKLKPIFIQVENIDYFDAYITFDFILKGLSPRSWFEGSCFYKENFVDTFDRFYIGKIKDYNEAIKIIATLEKRSEFWNIRDADSNYFTVVQRIRTKYSIQ